MSGDGEQKKWAALAGLVDAREAIPLEVMQEVFTRLPYGEKFTLSDWQRRPSAKVVGTGIMPE